MNFIQEEIVHMYNCARLSIFISVVLMYNMKIKNFGKCHGNLNPAEEVRNKLQIFLRPNFTDLLR